VVGQITRDLVLTVDQVPAPTNTTRVRERRGNLGGKGGNQAVGLAQLGVRVSLLGVVGDDQVGRRVLDQARSDGIDTSPVVRRSGTETAVVVNIVDGEGQWHYLESMPPATLLAEPDVAAAQALDVASAVLVQLQQPTSTARACRGTPCPRCRARVLLLDGAPEDERQRDALLATADTVGADTREAEKLTGTRVTDAESALRVGRELLRLGPWMVALEVSSDGNVFIWHGGEALIPLVDTPVVDTTGAGDALVAGLVAALLRRQEPRQAAHFAVAAAAATGDMPAGGPTCRPKRSTSNWSKSARSRLGPGSGPKM